jgi:hypothetical protein
MVNCDLQHGGELTARPNAVGVGIEIISDHKN